MLPLDAQLHYGTKDTDTVNQSTEASTRSQCEARKNVLGQGTFPATSFGLTGFESGASFFQSNAKPKLI